jgi:hypothetical protein
MDILKTTEPKSDQQNFDDYIGGPRTVTVSDVKRGSTEQPVEVHLVEFPGKPFKPSKSMRRVLVTAWGAEAAAYVGRRMTLYGDPTVKFGGQEVGGIRISHLSDITEALSIGLTVTRGKRAPFIVNPLGGVPVTELRTQLEAATTLTELQSAWELVRTAGQSKNVELVQVKDEAKSALTPAYDEAAPVEGEAI